MSLREKERIDYAIYHNTGLKVRQEVTVEHTVEMADELIRREKGLREDLVHTLDIYAIADAVSVDDLNDGIEQITLLAKDFRRVHVDLREALEDSYQEKYPDYQKNLNVLTDFIKESRKRKRILQDMNVTALPDVGVIVE